MTIMTQPSAWHSLNAFYILNHLLFLYVFFNLFFKAKGLRSILTQSSQQPYKVYICHRWVIGAGPLWEHEDG